MTLREENGEWYCRKSPKAKTEERVTDIIVFEGDFCVLMGKAGRTEFHAYLHKSGNKWLQMYGVTSLLGYWGEKDKLVQWAVDKAVEHISTSALSVSACDEQGNCEFDHYQVRTRHLDEARTAHKRSLNDASDKGKDVHAECEEWIKSAIANGGRMVAVRGDHSIQSQNFQKWAIEQGITFLASEKVLYSKKLWCAGTTDAIVEWNGKRYVLDLKTSNWISYKHFVQCGAYSLFAEEMGEAPFDGVIIVHLPRSGEFSQEKCIHVDEDVDNYQRDFSDLVRLTKRDKDKSYMLYN